ncbi:hypothetical protein SESBI_27443 [Sesbania bispinosa]|nr:hypothetical protein SESBI_27443 [Sesbania bispinosa]
MSIVIRAATLGMGDKIQASVSRDVLKLRRLSMEEDGLYDISRAIVVPNEGKDRPTSHRFRLVFDMSTQIVKRTGRTYTSLGLTPMTCTDIARKSDTDFLVDKVGLLTSLSPEREYIKGQRDTTVAFLEITDPTPECVHWKCMLVGRGIIECVLYDEYVDEVREYLKNEGPCTPIIVVQFDRIVPDGQVLFGDGGIESVVGVTRVLLYPEIPEVFEMMNWLGMSRFTMDKKVEYVNMDTPSQAMRDDFLLYHPRKQIAQLHTQGEVEPNPISSTYVLLSHGSTSQSYPPIFQRLIGKAMLFLVEKKPGINHLNEGCFIAKRLCAEPKIVCMFLRGEFFRIDRQTQSTVGKFLGKVREVEHFNLEHDVSSVHGIRVDSASVPPHAMGGPSSSGSGDNVNETHPSNPGQEVADPIDKECLVFSDGNS